MLHAVVAQAAPRTCWAGGRGSSQEDRKVATTAEEVSEGKVLKALKAHSSAGLLAHLDTTALSEDDIEKLLAVLQRHGPFVCKYPNASLEAFRERLFADLSDYVVERGKRTVATRLEELRTLIELCQEGYRRILAALKAAPSSNLSADVRVWAILEHIAAEFTELERRVDDHIAELGHVPPRMVLTNEDGTESDPDGVSENLVNLATMNILMEARINDWFDATEHVLLPTPPALDEADGAAAFAAVFLAHSWRQWEHTEERRRFLEGDLGVVAATDYPPTLPPEVDRLIRYRPEVGLELIDYVSNKRLNDRMAHTLFDMMRRTSLAKRATGIAGPRALPPGSIVSIEEGHSGVMLSEMVGYDITSDQQRHAGLRLLEWLRGYATLQCMARETATKNRVLRHTSEQDLVAILQRVGLEGERAKAFIDHASLRKNSRDLYDQPLVRCADGALVMFTPAIVGAMLTRVVLASLAALGVQLERKGDAFHDRVLKLFVDRGLEAKAIEIKRLGETYDFDVLVDWGDYIFLFECKNYSLSGGRPQQVFHFGLSLRSHAKQVNRLAAALKAHPDILDDAFGGSASRKIVIPCVVNALAYSFPDGLDGVYFTDASALGRFFEGRHIHAPHKTTISGTTDGAGPVPIHALWKGDSPTPEDLLEQLRNPIQFKLVADSVETRAFAFPLDATTRCWSEEFARSPLEVTEEAPPSPAVH